MGAADRRHDRCAAPDDRDRRRQRLANLLTIGVGVVTVIVLVVWFVAFSGRSRRARIRVLVGAIVLPILFCGMFRLEEMTGALIPQFALRFRSPPAAPPLRIDPAAERAPREVDLRTTTPFDFPRFLGPGGEQTV